MKTTASPGRYEHDFAGFTSQVGGYSAQIGCCYTYYFDEFDFLLAMRECENELTEEEKAELSTVHMFWHEETTARKLDLAFAKRYGYVPPKGYQGAGAGNCDCRVAGTNLDFEKLMTLGFDGLDREIDAAAEKNGASSFYTALKMWIESLRGACARYREQALAFSETAQSETARRRFAALADALLAIQHNPPKTFLEGVQLMWIYSVSSDLMNYGRMDDYLGGLYAADVDAGRITEEDGVQIVLALYKHFKEINKIHDCRVIIGGLGRRRPEAADRLAMVIMEASRRFRRGRAAAHAALLQRHERGGLPQGDGGQRRGHDVPDHLFRRNEHPRGAEGLRRFPRGGEQYVPFGCGEYVLVGRSVGTPNNGINALKALEIALHNGVDKFQNVRCGVETGALSEFDTFEKLYDAVLAQLKPIIDSFAVHKYLNYAVAGENAPYLHLSLLLDDCIARGKPVFEAACAT